jgi:hypothetical protein
MRPDCTADLCCQVHFRVPLKCSDATTVRCSLMQIAQLLFKTSKRISSPLSSFLSSSTARSMMVVISFHHIILFIWIVHFVSIIIVIVIVIIILSLIYCCIFLLYFLFRIRFLVLKFCVLRQASYMFMY